MEPDNIINLDDYRKKKQEKEEQAFLAEYYRRVEENTKHLFETDPPSKT